MAQQYGHYYEDRTLQQRSIPSYVYKVDEEGRVMDPPQLLLATTYYPSANTNDNNSMLDAVPLQRTNVTRIEAVVREVNNPNRVTAAVDPYSSPRAHHIAGGSTDRWKKSPHVDEFAIKLQDEAMNAIARAKLLGAYGDGGGYDTTASAALDMGKPQSSSSRESEYDDHPEVVCEDGVCRYKDPNHQGHGSLDTNSRGPGQWGNPLAKPAEAPKRAEEQRAPNVGDLRISPNLNEKKYYGGGLGPKDWMGGSQRSPKVNRGLGWSRGNGDDKHGPWKEEQKGSPKVLNPQDRKGGGLGWNGGGPKPKGEETGGGEERSPKANAQEQYRGGFGWNRGGPKEDEDVMTGSGAQRFPKDLNRGGTNNGQKQTGAAKVNSQDPDHGSIGWNRGGPMGDHIIGAQGSPRANPQTNYDGGYGSSPRAQSGASSNNQTSPSSNRQRYGGYGVPHRREQPEIRGKPMSPNSNRQAGYGGYGLPYRWDQSAVVDDDSHNSRKLPPPPQEEQSISPNSNRQGDGGGYGVPYRQDHSGDGDQQHNRWKNRPVAPHQQDTRGGNKLSPNSNRQGISVYGVLYRQDQSGVYDGDHSRWQNKPVIEQHMGGGTHMFPYANPQKHGDGAHESNAPARQYSTFTPSCLEEQIAGDSHVSGAAGSYTNVLFYGRSGARAGCVMSSKEAAERLGGIHI